jgi:hypothetical protein
MAAPDADILAAFAKRCTAYEGVTHPAASTKHDDAAWNEINEVERFLELCQAQTPRGVELQLWAALSHLIDDHPAGVEARSYQADLACFVGMKDALDWPARLIVSALQSLRAMGGAA